MKRQRSDFRAFDHFHAFDQSLNAEQARIRVELECANPGLQRDVLARKLRQIETALQIDDWVSSPGLQPPKLPLG